MKNSSPRNKIYLLVAVITVAISGGILYWNSIKYKLINEKIKSAVYEKSNGLYTVRYDKLDVDELGGYLHIINLQIIPDTVKFKQLIADRKNPAMVLSVVVPEITIAGVNTADALLSKKIKGRKLEIINATVVCFFSPTAADTGNKASKGEMYQQLLGDLKLIKTDTVEVSGISLSFINILTGNKTIDVSNVSVHLRDVRIDSAHHADSTRFLFSTQAIITGDKLTAINKPGTYFYQFGQFQFTSEEGLFAIKSIHIEPQLNEERFAAYSKIQHDRYNLNFKNLSLKHLNLQRLMLSEIVADSLVIKECSIKVYRDLSYPRDKTILTGTYPQQMLMKIPLVLSLKKVIIGNAFIEYKEKNPASSNSGKLQFTNGSAVISNITNETAKIKSANHCTVNFNARLLGMAGLHVRLDMILKDPHGKFLYSGSMEGFNAEKLNVLIEPMGLARIEKGVVNKLDFNYTGHDHGSDGKLTLLYQDLKMAVLKRDSAENKFEKKRLVSFIANALLKNANPQRKKAVRIAVVHYVRDADRSFFSLIWESIFSGVKQTAGL